MELEVMWNGDVNGPWRGYLNTKPVEVRAAPPLPVEWDRRQAQVRRATSDISVEYRIRQRLLQGPATKRELATCAQCGLWSVGRELRRLKATGRLERVYRCGGLTQQAVFQLRPELEPCA